MRWLVGVCAALAAFVFMAGGPVRAQTGIPGFDDLDDTQLGEAVDFVLGNALFVLIHETGHMLISEFELPVLGKEEDAVDSLSTMIMLEADDETFSNALVDASDGWFMSSEASEEAGADYALWDEHSLDEQRAYGIVCMMLGKDTDGFSHLEAAKEMPDSRKQGCPFEYEKVSTSWLQLLEPHMRHQEGESPVEIVYGDATSPELEPFAVMFREADMLGIVKVLIADLFKLEEGITFQAMSCGVANAFWDPSTRTVTYCYELSQFHAALVAKYYATHSE